MTLYPASYQYALSVTSQFYYCGLPLRLDSYSRCLSSCAYCFALARGGNTASASLAMGDPDAFARRLERLGTGAPPRSAIDEFLAHRQPIHFGGMSDPFPSLESTERVTLRFLQILRDFEYPTVISTKSELCADDAYLELLSAPHFAVQISISSLDGGLLGLIDRGTASPQRRLESLERLIAAGIPTACRIQPLLPTRESDATDVIEACAAIGVRHVAVEHLKLPLEKDWWGTRVLSTALGVDLDSHFKALGAQRIGREWILPPEARWERVLEIREMVHRTGMTFGAADNDFLFLSDGNCCCSGVDLFGPAFEEFYAFNYNEALRKGLDQKRIEINSLATEWVPSHSVARYMNSRSRIPGGANLRRYVEANWNGRPNGNSPASIYGVSALPETDERGFRVYGIEDQVLSTVERTPHPVVSS